MNNSVAITHTLSYFFGLQIMTLNLNLPWKIYFLAELYVELQKYLSKNERLNHTLKSIRYCC